MDDNSQIDPMTGLDPGTAAMVQAHRQIIANSLAQTQQQAIQSAQPKSIPDLKGLMRKGAPQQTYTMDTTTNPQTWGAPLMPGVSSG